MNWWAFLRDHGQRPANWWRPFTPAYWSQLNHERTATTHQHQTKIPCGECLTTTYRTPTGEVVRQDIHITVGRGALRP